MISDILGETLRGSSLHCDVLFRSSRCFFSVVFGYVAFSVFFLLFSRCVCMSVLCLCMSCFVFLLFCAWRISFCFVVVKFLLFVYVCFLVVCVLSVSVVAGFFAKKLSQDLVGNGKRSTFALAIGETAPRKRKAREPGRGAGAHRGGNAGRYLTDFHGQKKM